MTIKIKRENLIKSVVTLKNKIDTMSKKINTLDKKVTKISSTKSIKK